MAASDKFVPPSPSASLPGISPRGGFRFRRGQRAFLEALAEAFGRGETNHLGVFVPGYGKTITALASFVMAHALGVCDKLVVFVPRGNLRDQYADAEELSRLFHNLGAPPFTFCVADSDRVFLKNLDTQIVITTYQYASGEGGNAALRRFCARGRSLFVFDEVHHLAEDGTWAQQIDRLDFAAGIALSGTPMRSDDKTLFGVPFEVREDGRQYYVALHEVTMRDAHAEGGILKRVEAHVVDYRLRMVRGDTGEEVELSLSAMSEIAERSKEIDAYLARRKLRFHEVYLEHLLDPAFERFAEKRRALRREMTRRRRYTFRNHQMLVIAMSNRHAAAMYAFIRERYPDYAVARIGQDVPAAEREERLEAYRRGDVDVMVQVDMIGEGTDIKPISVIVKADLVRAYSKTLQQVFRGMRYFEPFGEAGNLCDIYAANDSDVVDTLEWITSEEQIGIKLKRDRRPAPPPPAGADTERSPWELTDVQRHRMRSHNLDLFRPPPRPRAEPAAQATDVNEREQTLRKECADLANEVAFALQAAGRGADIRQVHAAAKRRFRKAQDELSLGELVQKRDWLRRCLRARRLV